MPIDSDAGIRDLLLGVQRIAVLGAKAGPADDAFRVPRYLQTQGYRIQPINPKLDSLLGEPVHANLASLPAPVELLDVFRASQHLPGHAEEILALDPLPRAVWLQLGIHDDAVVARLEAAGIAVVQDRCIMVEHRRLLGASVDVVRVHFDFASTLCYVAHRLMQRMEDDLTGLGIELAWSPLDLSELTGWPRGASVPELRRANAARVASELDVPVTVPGTWPDSRWANASALVVDVEGPARAATWRERVFSALFEEGRNLGAPDKLIHLGRELGLALTRDDLVAARTALVTRTQAAAAEEVTGVPTFMLDGWPFGGVQSPDTMRSVFARWLRRRAG